MQTLSYFDEALKIDYLPAIREQLDNSSVLLNKVQRDEKDVEGKQWQLTAHYYRNSGVGAGSETGLPTAGQQKYKNPYDTVAYNRGRISVSGPVMAASKSDKGAVVKALDSEIKGVTADLKKDINFQLFNDGTGLRCYVNGDPSTGTTLTVDGPGTQYLTDGMIIDVKDATTGAEEDTDVTISTVDSSTQVTISAAADAAIEDNSRVIRANVCDTAGILPSDCYEMMGLKGIVDDATYVTTLHNLSRSTYAWWKCSTHSSDDNSGTNRDLDLDLIQASISAVEKNGGTTNMILSNVDIRDAYIALLLADKRFVNTLSLDGGWSGVEYSSGKPIPWVADTDCPPNTVFFIDLDHLYIMQMSGWDWMDRDGAVLSRVADSDAYEAVLYWYADLATDKPRAHSFLRDVE
jgi:hypothetical protein